MVLEKYKLSIMIKDTVKKHIIKLCPNNRYIILIICFSLFSCQNEKKEFLGEGNLEVSVKGVEDYVTIDNISKQSTNTRTIYPTIEIENYTGFDAFTSVEVQTPLAIDSLKSKVNQAVQQKMASTTTSQLANTVKYQLVFFKTSDNTIAANVDMTSGEAKRIQLDVGIEYKWIAYSINETTVPTFNTTTHLIDKDAIANKDLMYASNTITISSGDNFLNLVFKRYTTQYEVNIDTRGLFATIHDDSRISLNNNSNTLFQTADFNVLTGEFQGAPTNTTIDGSSLQAITPGENDIKRATFYTVVESQISPANTMSLAFAPLAITMENGSKREFTNTTINLNNPAVTGTTTRGRKYTINATLIESGIRVGTSNTIWARANLWYSADNATSKYRFRNSPFHRDLVNKNSLNILSDPNDLWRFNTKIPGGEVQTAGYDPCTDVYPLGLWKMPSDIDFTNLRSVNANNRPNNLFLLDRQEPWIPGLLGLVGNSRYYEIFAVWNNSNQSNTSNGYNTPYIDGDPNSTMNNLVLPGVGFANINNDIFYRPVFTSVLSIGELLSVLPVITGGGYYWTAKDLSNSSSLVKPHYFTFGVNGAGLLNANILELIKLNILNFDGYEESTSDRVLTGATTIGQNNWKSRLNIRCVRNSNYPNSATY